MNIPLLDKRVRSLEEMMADLIATSENTSRIVAQTSIEMARFKEEMREDRKSSKEEMNKFLAEMEAGRQKSDESMIKFKEEMRLDRRELNQKLGEIANKQGRMAEDLVAPSICRILRDTFRIPMLYECAANVRQKQIHPEDSGRMKEFDVIAICGDYVMVNETKSDPGASDIRKLRKTIRKFREYFPEHKDKKIVGSLGTLYAHESLIRYASRQGILILAVGDQLMDVMNEPGFVPRIF